jgi:hypothetical protein
MGKTWKDKNKWSKKQNDKSGKKGQKDYKELYTHKKPKITKFEWYDVDGNL